MDILSLLMVGTYEQRCVENTKKDDFTLDTVEVTDREWLYETAVQHKDFNNNDWVILEGTDTREEAEKCHEKWLKILEDGVATLTDCFTGEVFVKGGSENARTN